MEKKRFNPKISDGFSESAWKSLAIKSLRIGWVEGIEAAGKRLSPSTLQTSLISGIFEDVFPAGYQEITGCNKEIRNFDFQKLCERDTHHGRGLTDEFCSYEEQSGPMGEATFYALSTKVIQKTSLTWINKRISNCLWTWDMMKPNDVGAKREAMNHPFEGMPLAILDGHTYEGKKRGANVCLLSGHYDQHRVIGKIVMEKGWNELRRLFLQEEQLEVFKSALF